MSKYNEEVLETFNIDKIDNFSEWFTEIVKRAELADMRYNVKGFIVCMPFATIAMKKMFDFYEEELNRFGHEPVIFPMVIPESNFQVEKDHVEGFNPEVFWIERAGNDILEERLVLRPTSETAMYPLYSLWIRSWRDLPLKIYQSGSVFRYEGKSTRPFLRSREFWWIESHNVFKTMEEAIAQTREDMQIAYNVLKDIFGIPIIYFQRPEWDKFAGAVHTYAADTLMPDGKFLQLPSTHLLGSNFAKAFNITYTDQDGEEKIAYQTCYGPAISRIFGGMIAVHGDNNGLIFPFDVAPKQVVIIPIPKKKDIKYIEKYCVQIEDILRKKGYRVKIDLSDNRPGDKYYFWEMKGVPLRFEIGNKEVKEKTITIFRRDTRERTTIVFDDLVRTVKEFGASLTENISKIAQKKFDESISDVKTIDELEERINEKKIFKIPWCSIDLDGEDCAMEIKDQLAATVRGRDMREIDDNIIPQKDEKCFICGKPATCYVYVGKEY
ncbi:MAG: proline--tRNA ligase [Promethearchaeota archaeon]